MSDPAAHEPRVRASFADARDIDGFVEGLRRFERCEIDAERWRALRVGQGVHAQRQDGVQMLRVKLPQGIATAAQLRALADVAARFAGGSGHVTTRQNFQLHFVRPEHVELAIRRLAEAGITTSGAGGNQVRNVVACPLAGVATDEAFDVTPYAEAVTRWFLRHPLATSLPRKFKIAFEGCSEDHVATSVHDLGFRARLAPGGARGFAVTVAGGTSCACTPGAPLRELLPAADVLALAEAVVRVFHARGDRTNKQRNRLKFLVKDLGLERFRALVDEELARVRAEGAPRLPFDAAGPPEEAPPTGARPEAPSPEEIAARVSAARPHGQAMAPLVPQPAPLGAIAPFLRSNVAPQRQPGYAVVTVSLPQGKATAPQLEALASLAAAYGDGAVRLSPAGHALLRWVRQEDVAALFVRLSAAGLGRDGARSAADVLSCPGAEACRMALTRARGVAGLVEARIRSTLGVHALGTPVSVRASGCPNGCAHHHLAAIGLQGSARKLGAGAVPQYFVLLGGDAGGPAPRFGRIAAKVPARRVAEAVERLVALYLAERVEGEAAGPFFQRAFDRAQAAIAPLEELRPEQARPDDFVEPGAAEPFRPSTQEGECAA